MARLDGRIKGHERDIERMCNHHYQGFIDSVNELLKVRADARNLKAEKRKERLKKAYVYGGFSGQNTGGSVRFGTFWKTGKILI